MQNTGKGRAGPPGPPGKQGSPGPKGTINRGHSYDDLKKVAIK